jgi:DNA-binding transcriptional regulator GbsR (MarR family)
MVPLAPLAQVLIVAVNPGIRKQYFSTEDFFADLRRGALEHINGSDYREIFFAKKAAREIAKICDRGLSEQILRWSEQTASKRITALVSSGAKDYRDDKHLDIFKGSRGKLFYSFLLFLRLSEIDQFEFVDRLGRFG